MGARRSLSAKPSLGQHFLHDVGVVDAMLRALPADALPIVEIGPGPGALTDALLQTGRLSALVEKDRRFAAQWRCRHPHLQVLEQDAATKDWLAHVSAPVGVVGNLPYNAGTVILRRLILAHPCVPWLVIMLQREVAERITAAGSRRGGPMGLLAQLAYRVETVVDVAPGAFRPPPKVHSRVLRMQRRDDAVDSETLAWLWPRVTRLFERRRRRLDSALSHALGCPREPLQTLLARYPELPAGARPDHLSPALLAKLVPHLRALVAEQSA